MKFRRFENQLKIIDKAQRLLSEGVTGGVTREIPIKFALPLLTYGGLEEDDDLQDIWARLLANAADASTPMELRTAYIDMLKDLTAFDVRILSVLGRHELLWGNPDNEAASLIATGELPMRAIPHDPSSRQEVGSVSPEVTESLSNLARAGCIAPTYGFGGMPLFSLVAVTPMGLGLYRACSREGEP